MNAAIMQFLGSLVAILALAGIAYWLKLGRIDPIRNADHARLLADGISSGFDPLRVSLDDSRYGAILSDSSGQIMVMRRHGAHFAGRILGDGARAEIDQSGALRIATGERRFGNVVLKIDDPASWMQQINSTKAISHA